jgi:hypothetical protein
MMRKTFGLTMALGLATVAIDPTDALAASLRGSPAAMVEQNRVARDHGLAFYRTPADIHAAVERGDLVELTGNDDYAVADFVRFPFLQPAAVLFVERLSAQYRQACGQKLVVTSAVRPSNGQPSNSHRLSVHPAGMAVDLRVSDRAECRSWLEGTLMALERRGVLNGIREFHPPHYHVAVYPEPYLAYVAELEAAEAQRAAEEAAAAASEVAAEAVARAIAVVPGGAALAPIAAAAAPADPESSPRGALAATLAMIFALPIGVGVLARRLLAS